MRLRLSAYTQDPNLLAEFQRNLPALERFLRSNGAQVTLRIDTIEEDGHEVVLNSKVPAGALPVLDPRVVEEMKKRYGHR